MRKSSYNKVSSIPAKGSKLISGEVKIPPHMRAVEPTLSGRRRTNVWYSICFVVVEIILLACALIIARTPSPIDISGYGHRTAGAVCEIIIDGDSSAMIGLDPAVIEKRTGLKTCNIAESRSIQDFVGPIKPIDDYLAHNPLPRYLVTSWAPTDFELNREPRFSNAAEGFEYTIRYDRSPWLWKQMVLHPVDTAALLAWEERAMLRRIRLILTGTGGYTWTVRKRELRDSRHGWMSGDGIPETACEGTPKDDVTSTLQLNRTAVEFFRKRYEDKGIKVLVNVSPVADCVDNLEKKLALIEGLHDNRFETFPVHSFYEHDVHLTHEGAERYSEEVAAQILTRIKNDLQERP
jgi:hypothetical protein